MKKVKIIISLVVMTFFISAAAHAQKISVKKGDLSFFKGVTELNLAFDFTEFGVGKFKTEEAYIEEKKADMNEDEAGSGDAWEIAWHEDKGNTYEPKFEELINLVFLSKDVNIQVGAFTNADYTLILKTTFLEPGYNIGISRKDATINVEAAFVKTDDQENVILLITMNKVPGRGAFGGDFDVEYRIGEAYAKAGKELATYIWKKALK